MRGHKRKSKQLKQRVVEIFCQEFSGCVVTSVLIGLWLLVSRLTITIRHTDFFVRYTQKKLKALLCAQMSRFMVIKVNLEIKLPLLLSLESFDISFQIWNITCIIRIKIPYLQKKNTPHCCCIIFSAQFLAEQETTGTAETRKTRSSVDSKILSN